MSKPKFYWNSEEIFHSESRFLKEINVLEENVIKLKKLNDDLSKILINNKLSLFNGRILIFNSYENNPTGFVSPFLNSINISNEVVKQNNEQEILWLLLHEKMHILEAQLISNLDIQENEKINFFNKIVGKWISEPMEINIKINSKVFDIINLYVYNYNDIAIDWEKKFGYTFKDKFGENQYNPRQLMQTYRNLLIDDDKFYLIPNNDEGLQYLLDCFIGFLNHWASLLGDGDLASMKGKIISSYLLNWTLFKLLLETTRSSKDPFDILGEARAIYFSSILINRDINDYKMLFPIDEVKILEAERLKKKYGTDFKIENFVLSIENEQLSNEARDLAFRSIMGVER